LEITHTVTPIPKRKRNLDGGNTQDPGDLEEKETETEFDEVNDVPSRDVMQIPEIKIIVEGLVQEGPTFFEEYYVTSPC
jgi:hypothetical protein